MFSSLPQMCASLLLPPPFFFLKTLLLLSLFFPTSFATDAAEGYTACAPFSCGSFSNISYPFWSNSQPEYCGHPKFKLDCQQDNVTIDIMFQKFQVIDTNQKAQILKIARVDLLGNLCPKEYTSVSLDSAFFKYTSNDDSNATLLYDCDPLFPYVSPVNLNPSMSFNCPINGIPREAYLVPSTNWVNLSDLACNNSITVPVLEVAIQNFMRDALNVGYVLDEGFEVVWSGVDEAQCSSCKQSGGRCGHNVSIDEFICFCPNNQQSYGGICGNTPAPSPVPTPRHLPKISEQDDRAKNKGSRVGIKVRIGVASAVVGALVVGIAFYIHRRRKKNGYAMSYVQSQNLSSDPSLKDTEKGSRYLGVHLFTYGELEEATNYFDSARELGDGGFGTVYFGKLRDGRCVAVKRLYENNYRRVEQFMNEVEILTRLRHQNLVSLYGCTSRHSRELLLVYEFVPNGTVADHLHGEKAKTSTLRWHIRMNIAVETASALRYLHASDIIHRDVKTNNILLDNHFCVKVADFGLSRLFPNHITHISTAPQGTPGYVDPEYHQCYQLTNKSDVYSFGVVLIELISSLPAVDITRHRHEINLASMAVNKIHNQALHELVDPALGFESDLKVRKMINAVAELAFQCLQSSKDMRPTMEEVVDRLKDIQSNSKHKSQPEVMDISGDDDVVLLKEEPPPPSPDSNLGSKSTTPNTSG